MSSNAIERITEKGSTNDEDSEVDISGAFVAHASLQCLVALSLLKLMF